MTPLPRVTVRCHGAGCDTMIDTTIAHQHDAICRPCSKKRHAETTRAMRAAQRAGSYVPHGRGRVAKGGGIVVRDVVCQCHGKRLADCPGISAPLRTFEPVNVATFRPWKAQR